MASGNFSDFLVTNKMIGTDESIEKYKEDKRKRLQLEEDAACSEDAFLARIPTPSLEVQIGSLTLKNPFTAAAGCYGYGLEYKDIQKLSKLGAIFSNGTTLEPCNGCAQPRSYEAVAAVLQNTGYENPGIEAVKEDILPAIIEEDACLIINLCASTVKEFAAAAKALNKAKGAAGIELNLSCTNTATGNAFDYDADSVTEVVTAVRKATKLPLIVKLSVNTADIKLLAVAAEKAGADAISMINPPRGMALEINSAMPMLSEAVGGLCGPAIKPIALKAVWDAYQVVNIPIIGCGGISTAVDAIEFMIAGASAVQIGSANFIFPNRYNDMLGNLVKYMKTNGMTKISKIAGFAHRVNE